MSTLPHHKYPLRSLNNTPKCHHHRYLVHRRVTCSTTTTKPNMSSNKLMMEPRLANLSSLVTTTTTSPTGNPMDTSLESTWTHRAWVAAGCTTVLVSLAKSVLGADHSHIWLQPLLAGYAGYIFADLGSGVYHWSIDNYGDASTPVFGGQIEAFQGHHKWPWTITTRQFANNLHALARSIAFATLPLDLAFDDPTFHGFVSVCCFCIMFSQQFHAWAHCKKSNLPSLVVVLQEAGVLVSRSQHGAHHRQPFSNNYCIVSGVWNEFLDDNKVFEALEMVLFFKLGVRPRSWNEPNSDWIEHIPPSSLLLDQ